MSAGNDAEAQIGAMGQAFPMETVGASRIWLDAAASPNILSHELNHVAWHTYVAPTDGPARAQQFTRELFDYMRQNPTSDFTARVTNLLNGVNRDASTRTKISFNITPNSSAYVDNANVWTKVYGATPWFNELYADLTATIQYDIRRMPPQLRKYYPQWGYPSAPLGARTTGY